MLRVPVNTSLSNYIYVEFRKVFVSEASNSAFNLTAVTDHTPSFDLCYEAKDVTTTPMGPSVPTIDLVMHRPDAVWRITASNSMVRTTGDDADLWCLGIMNGGLSMKTSIMIGGYQMEDNLLQFDLESTKLGFSSSLLLQGTTCVGFTFTSVTNTQPHSNKPKHPIVSVLFHFLFFLIFL